MHDLAGKTVLVTGASKGIGAAIAAALGAAGAAVIAHYGTDRAGAEVATRDIPCRAQAFWSAPISRSPTRSTGCGARRRPGVAGSTS